MKFKIMRVLWSINNPLGWPLMHTNKFVIPKDVINLSERFLREVKPQGFTVLDGHQKLVIFSALGVSNSYCTPLKF